LLLLPSVPKMENPDTSKSCNTSTDWKVRCDHVLEDELMEARGPTSDRRIEKQPPIIASDQQRISVPFLLPSLPPR
jgi:hypothetical protein